MTDIRKISVVQTLTQDFEVDVDNWFIEFAEDWNEFSLAMNIDDSLKEDWIKEIAYDLAIEGALGPVRYEDDTVEVDIWK